MTAPGAIVRSSKFELEYRATKRHVDGRNIDEVTAELQARACNIQGSIATIRDRIVRRIYAKI